MDLTVLNLALPSISADLRPRRTSHANSRRHPSRRAGRRIDGRAAQAQWVVTPYLGINIGGDAEFRRGGPGGSVGYFGGRLGFEVEFQRYYHFFKDENLVDVVPGDRLGPPGAPCTDLDTDAMGFMGNVLVPIRIERAKNWRPYATAGLGVIHAWFDAPATSTTPTRTTLHSTWVAA